MYVDSKGRETAIICVTPIKNEDWILDRFLTLASEWADYIIIADQCSDDRSPEIAKSFEKVIYFLNEGEYDEQERSQLLLNEVRRIKAAKKLIVCLDADEALTLNWDKSEDWKLMLEANPKAIFSFNWINLISKNRELAINIPKTKLAYIDDNVSTFDLDITFHAPRYPNIKYPKLIELSNIGVLHFQYLATNRYYQKNSWYQIKEVIDKKNKNFIGIFRAYHKHINPDENNLIKLDPLWVKSGNFDLNVFEIEDKSLNWYGKDVISLLTKYGAKKFKLLNIWDFDWNTPNIRINKSKDEIKDPRSAFIKYIHTWLNNTQQKQKKITVRILQKLIYILYK
jgi:hypothetical protein